MATLARGGRLNVFGFVLRLAAHGAVPVHRRPLLRRRPRSAASLMRCWWSSSPRSSPRSGLRRGLAQLLADAKKPQACIVADALLVAAIGSAIGMAILIAFPKAMYPTTPVGGLDRLLAITVLAIAWTDIALAALAYHHDVGVDGPRALDRRAVDDQHRRLRAVVTCRSWSRRGDGLIIAYVLSMVAALIAALIPLVRCYGMPHGWKPDLPTAWRTAVAQRAARRRRRGRMGVAPDRPRGARRVPAGKLRRHLLCGAAGRDACRPS